MSTSTTFIAAAVTAAAALPVPPTPSPTPGPPITVSVPGLGQVVGAQDVSGSPGVAGFGNIPYALPPAGHLRWQPPQEHGPWASPRSARSFGKPCWQPGCTVTNDACSEDCLSLNIYAPISHLASNASVPKLPTVLWIHGGGYLSGSGMYYRGDTLVLSSLQTGNPVVYVCINYRLGPWGFLGSRALMADSLDGSTGNWGISDQRLAMRWVVQHIGAFGGDGKRLTIMGESAGGNSILQHLTQTSSFPYYQHAIIESGVYGGSKSGAYAESQYAAFVAHSPCANATDAAVTSCLRNLSATVVAQVAAAEMGPAANNGWGPIVDGVQNKDHELLQIQSGHFNTAARVLMGSNRDEAAAGHTRVNPNMTRGELELAFAHSGLTALDVKEAIKLYEPTPQGNYTYPKGYPGMWSRWWWINMRWHTDLPFGGMPGHCATRKAARLLMQGGASAVFVFDFQHATQVPGVSGGGSDGNGYVGNLLVPHAAEINYVHSAVPQSDAKEHLLAVQTSSYWAHFASTGDPTHSGLPRWPALQTTTDESVLLLDIEANEYGSPLRAVSSLRSDVCNFWERQFPSYYPE